MMSYDDLEAIKGTGASFDAFQPVSNVKLSKIKSAYSSVPLDYISFLEKIGFGELGKSAYMLYDGLVEPDEIYGYCPSNLSDVLLFGDDFQGFNTGFDVSDWCVVEVDPTNMQANIVSPSFGAFIRRKIAEQA